VSLDRLEVVLLEVMGDLLAEHRSLHVGGAKVDAAPYSGVDDLIQRVGEALEAPRGTGFVAEGAEGDLVGAEEVLERVNDCTHYRRCVPRGGQGRAAVARAFCGLCGASALRRTATRFALLLTYFRVTGRRVDVVRLGQERAQLRQGDGPDGDHHVPPVGHPRPPRRPREAPVPRSPIEERSQSDTF
jgi:hypothetical protein